MALTGGEVLRRSVISSRPDGLGTRLLTILYSRLLADEIGCDLKICWPSLNDRLYDTSDLLQRGSEWDVFANSNVFSDKMGSFGHLAEVEILSGHRVFALSGSGLSLEELTLDAICDVAGGYEFILYDLPVMPLLPGFSREVSFRRIKEYWRAISFNSEVFRAYTDISKAFALENAVVVHLRRGDVAVMPAEASVDKLLRDGCTQIFQRFLPLKTAADLINLHSEISQTVVVCSEDESMACKLSDLLPSRRVQSSNGFFRQGSTKLALLDLLIMSSCQTLISPFKSYFSECAATVGNCRHVSSGLDIKNLIEEIEPIILSSRRKDEASRLAAILITGWQNLWNEPGGYRDDLLNRAQKLDQLTVSKILGR